MHRKALQPTCMLCTPTAEACLPVQKAWAKTSSVMPRTAQQAEHFQHDTSCANHRHAASSASMRQAPTVCCAGERKGGCIDIGDGRHRKAAHECLCVASPEADIAHCTAANAGVGTRPSCWHACMQTASARAGAVQRPCTAAVAVACTKAFALVTVVTCAMAVAVACTLLDVSPVCMHHRMDFGILHRALEYLQATM